MALQDTLVLHPNLDFITDLNPLNGLHGLLLWLRHDVVRSVDVTDVKAAQFRDGLVLQLFVLNTFLILGNLDLEFVPAATWGGTSR